MVLYIFLKVTLIFVITFKSAVSPENRYNIKYLNKKSLKMKRGDHIWFKLKMLFQKRKKKSVEKTNAQFKKNLKN